MALLLLYQFVTFNFRRESGPMIRARGDREASVLFRVLVLLVGWGVRSIDAPENRYVVGLRVFKP